MPQAPSPPSTEPQGTQELAALAPEILAPESNVPLLLLVDHASNHIPPALAGLGLTAAQLNAHIAIDLGAAALARRLSEMMGATALLARVSRLVIDCNREPDHPTLIPEASDGILIAGNQGLSAGARQARIDAYYTPYHSACAQAVTAKLARGSVPLLVAVHSFTPVMNAVARPWEAAFLYSHDTRLAHGLMGFLERETDLTIGDNEPYSGHDLYYTMERHGMHHGLPQTTLEIRQDQLETEAQIAAWAALLADGLTEMMARPDVAFRKET